MALTVTDRGTFQTAAGGAITFTATSSSFSVAAGTILVVGISLNAENPESGNSDCSFNVSDTIADTGGGSWTQQATCTRGIVNSTSYLERVALWTRVIGSAPGASKTVTVTGLATTLNTSSDGWFAAHLWEVSGQHATPIGLFASPSPVTTGTTFNTDLGGVPAATSVVFGIIQDDASNGGATQPSGWTESDEQIPAWGATYEWAYDDASVQSPQWSGLHNGSRLLGAAVEIVAAATAAAGQTGPGRSLGRGGGSPAFQFVQKYGADPLGADASVSIPAEAAVTVAANNVTVAVSVSVGVAAVTATANNVTANPAASVGSAAVTVTGNNASHTIASTIGSAAVTATANNTGISNAHAVGNAAVTVTANNAAAVVAVNVAVGYAGVRVTAPNAQNRWPTSVAASGRYILDQNSNPWMIHGDTAWDLMVGVSFESAAIYLDDRSARGVNLILVEAFEHFFSTAPPANFYGDSPFTGTAYQSGLTAAYMAHLDRVIDYASMRGITVMLFPTYLGFTATEEGWDTEIVAASNAQMDTLGTTLGDRYETYSNLIWAGGGDRAPSATELDRIDHLMASIATAGDNHLATAHGNRNHDSAEYWTSYSWFDINAIYTADPNTVSISATGYNRAAVRPTFYIEGKYENLSGIGLAQIRREQWQCVLVGGLGGHVVGNEAIWSFGFNTGFSTNGYDWQTRLADTSITHSHQIRVLFDAVTEYVWKSLAPDLTDTFLTSGESSGATQAAASFSTHLGLVYVATTGSITVDLTELSGAATVLARWFDPTNGSFTSVGTFATSAPQTISHPGANAAGDNDWVLTVVDATVNVTVGSAAVSVTANNATVTTSSNVNVSVGSAAVSVTANNSSSAIAHAVGNAAVTATANNVTANPAPSVGLAAVTVTANNSGAAVAHAVGNAAVTVTGNNVTVTTTSDVNVAVGVATVTATANNAGVSAAHAVGVAAVTVTANNAAPTSGVNVTVGVATVTATANNSSAQVAAAVVVALVIVTAYDTFVDDGAGIATYASLVRMWRPKIVKRSR